MDFILKHNDSCILNLKVATRGGVDIHGPAGTVVLLNLSLLHTATARVTMAERKTVQTYYGHAGGVSAQAPPLPPTVPTNTHQHTHTHKW